MSGAPAPHSHLLTALPPTPSFSPQLRLGEVLALPQGPDEAAGFDLIHGWFLRFSLR